jgi:hypothetical protein
MELSSAVPIAAVLAAARPRSPASLTGVPDVVSTVLGRMLDLAAGRVDDAEALTDALGRLRTTLDRYAYFCPTWRGGRQFVASTLHAKLAEEFGAARSVSSSAQRAGRP